MRDNRAAEYTKRYLATALGAAIGLAGGLPGLVFGILVGWLIDQVRRPNETHVARFVSQPEAVHGRNASPKVATIALFVACGSIDGEPREETKGQIRAEIDRRCRARTPRARRSDHGIFFEVDFYRQSIRPDRIAAYLASRCDLDDRVDLVRAMMRIASAAGEGISAGERRLFRDLADIWDIPFATMEQTERLHGGLNRHAQQIMGVKSDVSKDELRAIYRSLARQFHPDTAAPLNALQQDEITGAFRHVQEAYELLRNQIDERDRTWCVP